jgi:hypothetical protein
LALEALSQGTGMRAIVAGNPAILVRMRDFGVENKHSGMWLKEAT